MRSRDFAFHLSHSEQIDAPDLARAIAVVETDLNRMQEDADRSRQAMVPTLAAILFTPPLILLGLGWLIGWVAVGFLRRS